MNRPFNHLLSQYAVSTSLPAGSKITVLPVADEEHLAQKAGISVREMQIETLKSGVIPERYIRNGTTISKKQQIRLLQSHVTIVGQGGLGGYVTEVLTRIGIGKLTLIDGDRFDASNLNRQTLATLENLGCNKAEVARQRVANINGAVETEAIAKYITHDNSDSFIRECTLAVDCLDSIPARFVLEAACRRQNIPLVSAAIGGTAGQATVIMPDGPGYTEIYGKEDDIREGKGIEKKAGALPHIAMLLSAICCNEIISYICNGSTSLQKKLLLAHPEDHSYPVLSLQTGDEPSASTLQQKTLKKSL